MLAHVGHLQPSQQASQVVACRARGPRDRVGRRRAEGRGGTHWRPREGIQEAGFADPRTANERQHVDIGGKAETTECFREDDPNLFRGQAKVLGGARSVGEAIERALQLVLSTLVD